jgi:hypothetical protein
MRNVHNRVAGIASASVSGVGITIPWNTNATLPQNVESFLAFDFGINRAIRFALLILALTVASEGQQIFGTVIVIAQTENRVIIAADSRAGTTLDGMSVQSIDDSYCKIAALAGGVVFAAAGLLSSGNQMWTATTEAANAAARVPHGKRIDAEEGNAIILDWASAMRERFRQFPSDGLSAYAHRDSDQLVTGLLAGVETDEVWIRAITIHYRKGGFVSDPTLTLSAHSPPTAYYFLGKGDIGDEFEARKLSGRAIEERASWDRMGLKDVPFDRFKARRLWN